MRFAGQDIKGEQFGLLTAKYVVNKTSYGNEWLLQCSCGRYAVRLLATLRQALRNGNEPMCSECLRELRRGSAISYRQLQKEKLLEYYKLYGTLWPPDYIDFLRKDIRRTTMEILGAWTASEEEDAEKEKHRVTSQAQDIHGNTISVTEHLEEYDAEQCDNGCGDANQEGFKLPPQNVLQIPWLAESAEERAERLEQAERHAMERARARQEAEAAKLKEKRREEWKKAKAKQAEEKKHEAATRELYQLRDAARSVIVQELANHQQPTAEEKRAAALAECRDFIIVARQEATSTLQPDEVPQCFGRNFSKKSHDCVGSDTRYECDLKDLCRKLYRIKPKCFGKLWSQHSMVCFGGRISGQPCPVRHLCSAEIGKSRE